MGILGTEFLIEGAGQSLSSVSVLEGTVRIETISHREAFDVHEGNKAVFNLDGSLKEVVPLTGRN